MAERSKQGLIISLGSIHADVQVRVERMPVAGETLIGRNLARFSGGKASNIAYLTQRFGVSTQLFGHVGDDDLAEQALGGLRAEGVDLSGVKRIERESTGVALITVPPDGQKGIILAPGAGEIWEQADVGEIVNAIADAPNHALVVIDCDIPVFVIDAVASAAKRRGCRVILDPSPAQELPNEVLAAADFLTPNASEAERLTGIKTTDEQSAIRAGKVLIERGAGAVCLKLPNGACVLVEKQTVSHVSGVPVDVVDTTGGGDAFTGGLAVALSEGRPALEAVRFGVACSHLTISYYGAKTAVMDRAAVEQMIDRLRITVEER